MLITYTPTGLRKFRRQMTVDEKIQKSMSMADVVAAAVEPDELDDIDKVRNQCILLTHALFCIRFLWTRNPRWWINDEVLCLVGRALTEYCKHDTTQAVRHS